MTHFSVANLEECEESHNESYEKLLDKPMKNFSLSYQTRLMYQIAYINLSNCIYHNLYRLIFKVIGTGYIISPE